MGRKSTYEKPAVYAAVSREIVEKGRFTLQGLSEATNMPIGSIYHRFSSREELLAETWLNAVRSFQMPFLAAIRDASADASIEAGAEAALATPRFCRSNPDAAIVLACCRKEEFLGPETSADVAAKMTSVNDEITREVRRFAKRIGRPLLACRLALRSYPLAAVQLYLPHRRVPRSIDAAILKAYHAALSKSDAAH